MEFVMIRRLGIFALLYLVSLCTVSGSADKVSVACMMAFDEGGVRGVLNSSECLQWVPSLEILQGNRQNCQFAMLQGRREYQEDRVSCNLEMKIPYLDKYGIQETTIGIAAVFDGHGGSEASELASNKFLDYFRLHVQFNIYKHAFPFKPEDDETGRYKESARERSLLEIDDNSLHDILKEALMKTFKDIDSEFSTEALSKGYISGSTGTVVLLLNGQFLIGYVGDSKALLCREKFLSHQVTELYAEELTTDHHPDRDDETARIKAASGIIKVWGVPRVNGILAVSRAIGDVSLKRFGVIAVPEVIGWRNLTSEDSYLLVASDGIFEELTPQHVCDIMQSTYIVDKQASKRLFPCLSSSSLADCIVETAFKKGSTDNLSVIVIPLRPTSSSRQDDAEALDKAEL